MTEKQIIKRAKEKLSNIINNINDNTQLYVKNKESNFTRNRKMNLGDVLKTMLSMEVVLLNQNYLKYLNMM